MVYFSNKSTNASRYEWSFGDSHSSTESAPNHSYTHTGTYSVKLTAYSASGSKKDEATATIYVSNPTGDAMFWMSQQSYIVKVTLLGTTKSIDYYYSYSTPTCGDDGCANFYDVEEGTYSYYAENSLYWWSGTITVKEDCCSKIMLYISDGKLRDTMGEQTKLMEPIY